MSNGPTSIQDAHYRRGVVLGLTIGEAILLLLFSLLLVLAIPLVDYAEQNRQRMREIERINAALSEKDESLSAKEKELSSLRERAAQLQALTGKGIEDITKEYLRLAERARVLEAKLREHERSAAVFKLIMDLTKIAPSAGGPESEIAAVQAVAAEIAAFQEIKESTSDALGAEAVGSDPAQIAQAVKQLSAEAKRARLSDLDKAAIVERAAAAEEKQREALRELHNTKGQMENLKRQLAEGGRGMEAVPCWSTPAGKPEYIFDVALTSQGLVMRDRKLDHRADEQTKLPLSDIRFESELTPQRFLAATKPLYDWSVQHECRFFVRAFDKTGETEKIIFKRHIRFLETHFYKYEELNERF